MQANSQPFKGCVVAILSLAWLVASNHCAIASLTGGHAKAEHSCCAKDKPGKSSTPCVQSCCKKMAAPVKVADTFVGSQLVMIAILSVGLPRVPEPAFSEGGSDPSPPGGSFFVSFVLGCGQHALAPPVFVA
jgi:hypothetical protein